MKLALGLEAAPVHSIHLNILVTPVLRSMLRLVGYTVEPVDCIVKLKDYTVEPVGCNVAQERCIEVPAHCSKKPEVCSAKLEPAQHIGCHIRWMRAGDSYAEGCTRCIHAAVDYIDQDGLHIRPQAGNTEEDLQDTTVLDTWELAPELALVDCGRLEPKAPHSGHNFLRSALGTQNSV
jgi:hypothetical protein